MLRERDELVMYGKKVLVGAMLCSFLLGCTVNTAKASDYLDKFLKGGAIGTFINVTGPAINDAINFVLVKVNMANDYATKVVPVLSIGDDSKIGAVQISGAKEQVEKCKAVVQVEKTVCNVHVVILVPVDNFSPFNVNRVQGVGVSAQIDTKL